MEVQQRLAHVGVAFVPWLVLETLQEVIDQSGDAANQATVAARSGLTKKVVSFWMIALSEQGLVDRGPDMDGRAYRVILTKYGTKTLLTCRAQLFGEGRNGNAEAPKT